MSVTTTPGASSPADHVVAAIASLRSAQLQCRARPKLVVELESVLGRLGDLRRALLVAGVPQQHGVSVVGGASGIHSRCLCSWTSPHQAVHTEEDRATAWVRAERSGIAHLASVQGGRAP